MTDYKAIAAAVQRMGAKNVKGDTVLAHITPEEAVKLKAEGGSGEIDPETGLPHYREVDSGGGGDGNESGSQHSGNEGRGGYGGGGSDGGDGYEGEVNTYLNGVTTPIRTAIPGYETSVPSVTSKGSKWGAVWGGLFGGALAGVPGAVKGAQMGYGIGKGKQVSGLGNTSGYNSVDGTSSGGGWGNYGSGGNNNDSKTLTANLGAGTSKAAAVAAPTAADAIMDTFTTAARKKMGFRSTVMTSGLNTAMTTNKSLTGA